MDVFHNLNVLFDFGGDLQFHEKLQLLFRGRESMSDMAKKDQRTSPKVSEVSTSYPWNFQ